jgi:two-component system chemotaxis sensor kinase CheA
MSEKKKEISKKALKEFLSEAEDVIEKLNQDLLRLDAGGKEGTVAPDLINEIFRSAHSLKGLSGMFGFTDLSSLSHELESMLDKLRLGKIRMTPSLLDLLFEAVELLRRLVEHTSGGFEEADARDVKAMVARLEEGVVEKDASGQKGPLDEIEIDPGVLNVLTEYEEHRLEENIRLRRRIYEVHAKFDLLTFDQSLRELTSKLKQLGEVITTLPSANPSKESEIEFEIVLGSQAGETELRAALDRLDATLVEVPYRDQASRREQPEFAAAPMAIEEPDLADEEKSDESVSSLKSVSETVRVDIRKLDYLMNLVGELGLVRSNVSKVAEEMTGGSGSASSSRDLRKITKEFDRKLSELQAGVMDVRMVPLRQVFDKLSRIVRKTSRDVGKSVRLEVEGADTELDKLIIEELVDPLMHVVRNAIDHGLESTAVRVAQGKPPEGTIRIKASQQGNHVVIEVEDDGRGMRPDEIYRTAVSKGLIGPDAQLSDREILDLTLLPGFSTKEKVTEVSGRGVGLDIVKENISKLSGIINIDSEPGKGTRLSMVLPITLAIIQALLLEVRGRRYAIPLNSVLECLTVGREEIQTIERREVLQLRDTILPLVRLDSFFRLPGSEERPEKSFVVVAGMAEHRLGIVVDRLRDRQDIVIKSIGKPLQNVPGIAGATELGDQQTVLVIDVSALIEESIRRRE